MEGSLSKVANSIRDKVLYIRLFIEYYKKLNTSLTIEAVLLALKGSSQVIYDYSNYNINSDNLTMYELEFNKYIYHKFTDVSNDSTPYTPSIKSLRFIGINSKVVRDLNNYFFYKYEDMYTSMTERGRSDLNDIYYKISRS